MVLRCLWLIYIYYCIYKKLNLIKIGKGTKLVEAVVRVRDKNTGIPEWEELKEREQENSTSKNENKAIRINYVKTIPSIMCSVELKLWILIDLSVNSEWK